MAIMNGQVTIVLLQWRYLYGFKRGAPSLCELWLLPEPRPRMAATERCNEASMADTVGGPLSPPGPRSLNGPGEARVASFRGAGGAVPGGGEHTLIERRLAKDRLDLLLIGIRSVLYEARCSSHKDRWRESLRLRSVVYTKRSNRNCSAGDILILLDESAGVGTDPQMSDVAKIGVSPVAHVSLLEIPQIVVTYHKEWLIVI
ncbi:hypothetical protein Hamer_G016333 [Homarus americanus]|uniref:Uncharacterized protein n=1 Tax=Homarus americanus TaxID=6706 RepID=A0A8J5MRG8_HOMAM|nr:hypothetical protein Hamer_G016333 [Homarus americanus]